MRVKCDGCGKVLKEDQRFYVITLAYVLVNDGKIWDYQREEDDSLFCLDCAGKKLPK